MKKRLKGESGVYSINLKQDDRSHVNTVTDNQIPGKLSPTDCDCQIEQALLNAG